MKARLLASLFATVLMTAPGVASATAILGATQSAQDAPTQLVGGMHGAGGFAGGAGGSPYPVDIFVRGGFNDWGIFNPMTYDAGSGVYSAVIDIAAGDWEFKIASEDWSTVDLGAGGGDPTVVLDSARLIGTGAFGNLALSITTAGLYTFTLDTSTGLDSPTLLVSAFTAIPEPTTLALIGLPLVWLAVTRRRKTRGF